MCNRGQKLAFAGFVAGALALAGAAPALGQPTPCPGSGTGVVTVSGDFGSCVAGVAPTGDSPYSWDVTEDGSYFLTVTGVTECNGDAITLFLQASNASSFCVTAYPTENAGTYLADFVMPSPACFTYLISYKCGADAVCDNTGTFTAQGPGGACTVQLRAANFSFAEGFCQFLGFDEDCGNGVENCLIIPSPGGDLGCNPDPALYDCNVALATILPQGGCTVGDVECVAGVPEPYVGDGVPCNSWIVTNTYFATCGAASCTETQTYTWREVARPVFDNCENGISDLGCNPANIPDCDSGVTAHDDCGPVDVNCTVLDHAVACLHIRSLTYTATNCAGTSTCTKTYTWTQVSLPSFDNCQTTTTSLGCNPTTVPDCDSSVTARDECGSLAVTCDVSNSANGCHHTRTLTYTATNCAGTSTCTHTFTWDVVSSPMFDNCNSGTTVLGCNPANIPDCDAGVTAHDECGTVTVTCASSDQVDGCHHTRTVTYTATNCAGTSTCTRTFTWDMLSSPMFDNCNDGNTELGCNPASIPGCDAGATAHDECGSVVVHCASSDTEVGCHHTRTLTYMATNCAGTSTCVRTFTWDVVSAPTFENCASDNTDLGCNPTSVPGCDASVTAHDDCGSVNVVCGSSDTVNGCNHTRTLTYTATNCGGTSTCSRTYTWMQLATPEFDNCESGNSDLGCNPTSVPGCDPGVSAHDDCGSVNVACDSIDTASSCHHTRTLTYTATNCAGTSTCTQTYTWMQLATPEFDNCVSGTTDLGNNPASTPDCDASVTAHDECGSVTVTCASSDQVNGCHHTRTLTYTATNCAGTNTCTQIYTWRQGPGLTFDNCVSGNTPLGCNPSSIPGPDSAITASDSCGPVTVTNDGGHDSGDDCQGHTRTITYTATGSGGQTATCTRTYTWTQVSLPDFDHCITGSTDLGCNPTTVPGCDGGVTAHDNCGVVDVDCTSSDTVVGCRHTRTLTYTATNCAGTSTCTQTFTWDVLSSPTFDNCASGYTDLGCNPTSIPGCDGGVTAHDDCGSVAVVCGSSDTANGCHHTRTLTYTATNCAGTSTCTRTFTWDVLSSPTFDNCNGGNTELGCSPASIPNCDTGATAHDECGPVNVTCSSSDTAVGCHHTRTLTYTAINCAGTSTCTRTFTWSVLSSPTLDNCLNSTTDLGCNPATVPGCDASVTAHDDCGSVNVDCVSNDTVNGCDHTRTLTYTATNCAGTSTCTQTYTWSVHALPTFGNCLNSTTDLGCNPASVPGCDASVTAHDDCGSVNVDCVSNDTVNGCDHTRTLTYTATNCAGTSTCTQTYTWTVHSSPTFDNCQSGTTQLGCSPATIPGPDPSITASDNCGPVTVTNDGGRDSGSDCEGRTRTITYTATGPCGQTATCTRTFTWTFGTITACKFYDANANGIQDAGEAGIGNWRFKVTLNGAEFASGLTAANGCITFCGVPNGAYVVTETLSGTWQNTTPLSKTVTVGSANCGPTVKFGNVCFVGGVNGFTLGFWSNKNGAKILTDRYINGGGWAAALNGLNLRNANGSDFVLSTTNATADATALRIWLLGADATNMAYMLSAQLAATKLDTMLKGLSDGSVLRVPGGMKTQANVCIVPLASVAQPVACGASPLLALTAIPGSAACGCASNDGLASVGDICARANCLLGAYPTLASAPSGSLQRNYMESVKDLLDVINNNGNPSGSSAYPCGPANGAIQFVSPTPCPH